MISDRDTNNESTSNESTNNENLDNFHIEASTTTKSNSSRADFVRGLCGLQNLGNTCFMNSAIQCLSNVPELTTYFLEDKYADEINANNPLGTGGHLVKDYAELLKEMWSGQFTSVRPYVLKQTIGRFAPRFTGHAQHDSQELTAFLLDGLHEDLNRIKQKPYVEEKELSGQDESEAAKQSWEDYRKRNDSIIVDLLHGQHKSTLTCNVCSKISIKFEPFCFLSVPVPTRELKLHTTVIFMRVEKWAKFWVAHTAKTTASQLKHMLCEQLPLPPNTQMVIFSSGSGRLLTDDSPLATSQVYNYSSKLYAYAVEPGALIMVDNYFTNSGSPPLFLPRPAKLTRRAVLEELVPRVRELCLSSSSSLSSSPLPASSSSFTAGCSAAGAAPCSSSSTSSSSALVIALPPCASTSLSPSTSLSIFSSSSSTIAAAMPPPTVSSSSCSSASSTLSPPPSLVTTTTSPTKPSLSTGVVMATNNDDTFDGNRLSSGSADGGGGSGGGGGSSPSRGGTAMTAAGPAALPSSSLQSSSPVGGGGRIVVTSTNGGGDAFDHSVASPHTPASIAASEPADDTAHQQEQHHNDEYEPMDTTDTMDNNDQEQQQSAPIMLPTPTGIELLVKETCQKIQFPEDMDEEVMQLLPDNVTDGEADTDEGPVSPVIVKLYWNSMLRSRFDGIEMNQLVDREVNMINTLKKSYTLKECIDMYTQQEQLNEEDSWYCPNCKTHRRAFKKLDLWALPQILIVHLKRFIYSRYTRDKIETDLEIPIRGLDLGDKVLNPAHSEDKYDLIGISNHSGGLGSGHYTACALNGTDWCEFNDSSACRMLREVVPNTFTSREAYMLFYRRREKTTEQPTPKQQQQEEDGKEETEAEEQQLQQ